MTTDEMIAITIIVVSLLMGFILTKAYCWYNKDFSDDPFTYGEGRMLLYLFSTIFWFIITPLYILVFLVYMLRILKSKKER